VRKIQVSLKSGKIAGNWRKEPWGEGVKARGTNASPVIMVNTQNVSVTKIVESSSIQCAESKYGLRIQFLALIVMIH